MFLLILDCEEEELATISSDRGLRITHSTVPIDAFWTSIQEECPTLAKKALPLLLQFFIYVNEASQP